MDMIRARLLSLRFDGDVIKTDETIRTLAQKWQPAKRILTEERHTKAVDTDMIIIPCAVRFWAICKLLNVRFENDQ